ncbi:hypothetical protein PZE06_21905 [Robertmurraya sp. DFI.2.37]|nr:hypothetical protein [Robertmurraya sp. DFI.2.37]MDF1510793.1 hypothetical protein [Robertmurraya sp. DFI.2.37]
MIGDTFAQCAESTNIYGNPAFMSFQQQVAVLLFNGFVKQYG